MKLLAGRWWLLYLLAGLAASVVAVRAGQPWSGRLLAWTDLSTCLAVVAGIRRHRPDRPGFWWLTAAALLTFGGAHLLHGHRRLDLAVLALAFALCTAALIVRVRQCSPPGQLRAG